MTRATELKDSIGLRLKLSRDKKSFGEKQCRGKADSRQATHLEWKTVIFYDMKKKRHSHLRAVSSHRYWQYMKKMRENHLGREGLLPHFDREMHGGIVRQNKPVAQE